MNLLGPLFTYAFLFVSCASATQNVKHEAVETFIDRTTPVKSVLAASDPKTQVELKNSVRDSSLEKPHAMSGRLR